MPIRAFLVTHVSVCLLITTTCSAVFARFGWLNRFGASDRSVFLFERLFQLFESVSCRLPESLCAADRVDACRLCRTVFFCVCDRFRLFCCAWRAPRRSYLGLSVWWIPFPVLCCRFDKSSGGRLITSCCSLLALLRRDFYFFLDCLLCFVSVVGAYLTVCLHVFPRFFVFSAKFADFCYACTGCLFL